MHAPATTSFHADAQIPRFARDDSSCLDTETVGLILLKYRFALMKTLLLVLTLSNWLVLPCVAAAQDSDVPNLATPQEKHLKNVRQLTFGGQNAEAYFSAGGKKLIFQSTRDNLQCDQMFTMNIDGSDVRMVSNGKGRTTCGYFFPDGKTILYSSTYVADPQCPPRPDFSKGYVWAVYPGFDIFAANPDGSGLMQLTNSPGYDAEATISPNGKHIVFTSVRNGDLDIYTMRRRRQARKTTNARTWIRWWACLLARWKMDRLSRLSSEERKRN